MFHRITKHPLFVPLTVGLILRLIFVFISNHIYYPDELYQSLEQAFRLVNGYGLSPWDFVYGLRSFAFPLLLSLPLNLAKMFQVTDPALYHYFPQIFLIFLSLSQIIAAYRMVWHIAHNRRVAQYAAFIIAIWYELIYFSPRALTEMMSLNLFSFAIIALLGKKPKYMLGASCITAAIIFRPQLGLIGCLTAYPLIKKMHHQIRLIMGALIAVIIFGTIDQWYLGHFLSHLMTNITISYGSGISDLFGSRAWWYYLASLSATSCGIWLLGLPKLKGKAYNLLWYSLITTLILHSLIPHKEYRFIIISIPLWICLFTLNFHHVIRHQNNSKKNHLWSIALGIITLISVSGLFNRLPYQSTAYGQPLLLSDPNTAVYYRLYHDPHLCAIYDVTRNWVYTPGYYGLNREVPLYSADYPPSNPNAISHYILPDNNFELKGFIKQFSTLEYTILVDGKPVVMPGYTVYKNDSNPCQPDPNFTYYRSFEAVEAVLKSISAKPLIGQ